MEWRKIEGYYPYEASSTGLIRNSETGNELRFNIGGGGYYRFSAKRDGVYITAKVHQLVAIAFHNHIIDGYSVVVNHLNEDKLDNRASNLELTTNRDNCIHSIDKTKTSSKYIGVSWYKKMDKWRVTMRFNRNQYYTLGYFDDEEEAAKTYIDAKEKVDSGREDEINYIKPPVRSSEYEGVSHHKKNDKWTCYAKIDGKRKYIGSFETEIEAYEARKKFIKKGSV
tara:strand:+ start:12881 stop:13555 length:675 start_codon:yes stop_codon:yes gene_type:complete